MDKHLFKLKKDGKTVGYLKLANGWTQFQRIGRDDWYYPCDFKWNTAHPFVTKDKNGKDIYKGDETNKGIAISTFENWIWTYTKDPSTYHWHINITADILLAAESGG